MATSERINPLQKKLYKDLHHGHRRRKRGHRHDTRGVITGRVSIESRPAIVQSRKRIGDIEVALLMGENAVSQSVRRILHKATYLLHTLTFDNDKGFPEHLAIGLALGLKSHFTRTYTSKDKETIENRTGQIRRLRPKKTALHKISHHRVRQVEEFLNNRLVRNFRYKTPNQELKEKTAQITYNYI